MGPDMGPYLAVCQVYMLVKMNIGYTKGIRNIFLMKLCG